MSRPQRTALNLAIVSCASLVQIVNQFVFLKINSYLFGTTAETDALAFALTLATAASAMVTGSLAYVLVPDLVAKFENDDEERGWQLTSYVGLVMLLSTGLVAGLLFLLAGPICELLYGTGSEAAGVSGGEELSKAALYLRILSLQIVLQGMISWAQAVLHSQHQFSWAAAGGVVGTGLQVLLMYCIGGSSVSWIAWAILFGSAVSLAIHLPPLIGKLRFPRADNANLLRLLSALWPLLLGAAFQRLEPVFTQSWAASLDEGIATLLHRGTKILMALLTIGTSSLALVAFPQLAGRYANEGKEGFGEHFSLCARRMALILVPIAIGVSLFATPIVRDLLEGGEFTLEDSQTLGILVTLMMGLFVGASVAELVSRGFYVLGDTRTPTVIGVLCLAVCLCIRYVLYRVNGAWGMSLGISIYFVVTAAVLTISLRRRVGVPVLEGLGVAMVQAVAASLVACGCCFLVYHWKAGGTWVAGPVGCISYCLALLAVQNDDAKRAAKAAQLKARALMRGLNSD